MRHGAGIWISLLLCNGAWAQEAVEKWPQPARPAANWPQQVVDMPPLEVDQPFLNPLVPPPVPVWGLDYHLVHKFRRRYKEPDKPQDLEARAVLQGFSSVDEARYWVQKMADEHMQAAMGQGVDKVRAERMGGVYNQVLARLLQAGWTAEAARARAEAVFQQLLAQPGGGNTEQEATQDFLAAGVDSNSRTTNLAQAQSAAGQRAFDAALSGALAKGASMADALAAARQAVSQQDKLVAAERARAAPGLVNGQPDVSRLSAAAKQLFHNLIAKGNTPESAMRRALAWRDDASLGVVAPLSLSVERKIRPVPRDDSFASRLARGEVTTQELPDALTIQRMVQGRAGRIQPATPKVDQPTTLAESLANGQAQQALPSAGETQFDRGFDRAISVGKNPQQALSLAQRASEASRFRFPLPPAWRAVLHGRQAWQLQQDNGTPLPAWLQLELASASLLARRVPDGGLPLAVRLLSGGKSWRVWVQDGQLPAGNAGQILLK